MNSQINLVSIIVPVFNAENFLEEAIQSVIAQTYPNWELLLIDDGSKDGSLEIIKKYRNEKNIFLFQHPGASNLGVSKSRELGIKNAKGDYIAFLDADDFFLPDKLEIQLKIFAENSLVVLVHSDAFIVNETKVSFTSPFSLFSNSQVYNFGEQSFFLKYNPICNSSVVIRKLASKGMFQGHPQAFQYEDWANWCRLAEKGKFYFCKSELVNYRLHSNSATSGILKNLLLSHYSYMELSIILLDSGKRNESIIKEELKYHFKSLFNNYYGENKSYEMQKKFWKLLKPENQLRKYWKSLKLLFASKRVS